MIFLPMEVSFFFVKKTYNEPWYFETEVSFDPGEEK